MRQGQSHDWLYFSEVVLKDVSKILDSKPQQNLTTHDPRA